MRSVLSLLILCTALCQGAIAQVRVCTEMLIPEEANFNPPVHVMRAVAFKPELGKYWENGSTIRVRFMGGSQYVRERIKFYANQWSSYANIRFEFTESGSATIRIAFDPNTGSWSYIGKDALSIPASQATMNYGWLTERTTEAEYQRVVLHEFGHALGLLHEHQHPTGGIPWNEEAVYKHYEKLGWSRDQTYKQVMTRYERSNTQYSSYDPKSIMHYPVPMELTRQNYKVDWNTQLSSTDIAFIGKVYPKTNTTEVVTTNTGSTGDKTGTRPGPPGGSGTGTVTGTGGTTNVRMAKLRVTDVLGEGQKAEHAYVTINGVTRTFELDYYKLKTDATEFNLKPGSYPYKIVTYTTYYEYKKVLRNGKYVDDYREYEVYGYGEGTLKVDGQLCVTLYGGRQISDDYVEVYLDKCQ